MLLRTLLELASHRTNVVVVGDDNDNDDVAVVPPAVHGRAGQSVAACTGQRRACCVLPPPPLGSSASVLVAQRRARWRQQRRSRRSPAPYAETTGGRRPLWARDVRHAARQGGVGAVLGLCTGFACKEIGKFAMVVVGTELLLLRLLEWRGYVQLNWRQLARDFNPLMDAETGSVRVRMHDIFEALSRGMPFAASFIGGACLGLRFRL